MKDNQKIVRIFYKKKRLDDIKPFRIHRTCLRDAFRTGFGLTNFLNYKDSLCTERMEDD